MPAMIEYEMNAMLLAMPRQRTLRIDVTEKVARTRAAAI
jgi:hypothetical protein